MTYSADIDRRHPGCFICLVDQSASMQEQCSGAEDGISKAQVLASGINAVLWEICIICSRPEIRDLFQVAVIGYGARIHSLFSGLIPVSEMAKGARIEQRVDPMTGGRFRTPMWLDAVAAGMTPMCAALADAQVVAAEWVRNYPNSFPPIVFHLTDGQASDGDPAEIAQKLRAVATTDGNVLLFNGYLSAVASGVVEFPVSKADLPPNDRYAHRLFEMSSIIPESMRLSRNIWGIEPGGRGMLFNVDFSAVVKLLDIGS